MKIRLKLEPQHTYSTLSVQIVANILATLGRYDVPVGVGRLTGGGGYPQESIVANYSLDEFVSQGGTVYQGVDYMTQLLLASDPSNPTFVVEIAPPTSLGDVLRATPSAARNVITVAMSGSIYTGYGNSSSPSAEYNVHADITSAQAVYNASWLSPLVTAPLDTTVFDQFCNPEYQAMLVTNDTAHPFVASLLANYVAWYNGGGKSFGAIKPFNLTSGTSTLYDLQAAYMTATLGAWWAAGRPGGVPSLPHFTLSQVQVTVNSGGYTVLGAGQPVWAATGFVGGWPALSANIDGFSADVISSLILPRPAPTA